MLESLLIYLTHTSSLHSQYNTLSNVRFYLSETRPAVQLPHILLRALFLEIPQQLLFHWYYFDP